MPRDAPVTSATLPFSTTIQPSAYRPRQPGMLPV
jgi:hypothetical protein